jgi:MFS family permease
MRHVGLYVGFYRILAGATRPYYEVIYLRWPHRMVLILSLFILQVGWLFCSLASSSWFYVSGRALSGIGSTGVTTTSTLLFREHDLPRVAMWLRVLTGIEWVLCMIGPLYVVPGHWTWLKTDHIFTGLS